MVAGGAGSDLIEDGPRANTLDGGAGDDQLNGGEGDDVLLGGDGTTLQGRAGAIASTAAPATTSCTPTATRTPR